MLGVLRVPPAREDEGDVVAELGGDIVLVLQEVLAVFLTEVGLHLLRPVHQGITNDKPLFFLEEAEDFVRATADGQLSGDAGPDEVITEGLDFARVVRADKSLEPVISNLSLEMCY